MKVADGLHRTSSLSCMFGHQRWQERRHGRNVICTLVACRMLLVALVLGAIVRSITKCCVCEKGPAEAEASRRE